MVHEVGTTFKPLVEIKAPDECWEWKGSINKKTGYGKKQLAGKTLLAHRWIWEMLQGPIPKDMVINHKCSNRSCVNPTHLEVVTFSENCRHGKCGKLSRVQAKTIKRLKPYRSGKLAIKLAQRYNISRQTPHDIWYGRSWRDI
ncbi:MAG: HNH endonuclease [Ignavibacteriaceae bacterium]|nr:HNH endonuclease [Ignavibacteriaceae bacterium]